MEDRSALRGDSKLFVVKGGGNTRTFCVGSRENASLLKVRKYKCRFKYLIHSLLLGKA